MTPQSPHHDFPTAHGDRTDDRQVLHALWSTSGEISRSLQRSSAQRPQPVLAAI